MPSTISREWSSSNITTAISALELWLEEEPLKPVSEERIIKSYGVIGEILQLEVPTPGALRVIADLLKEIPDVVWPLAVRDVLRDHQYNTLPKPAAFVRAAASYEGGAHSCVRLVEHTIKKLKAAR